MDKVSIDFENCYGIGKLSYDFDYTRTGTFLIYAPNGTMKTSLAKTFRYFANEGAQEPCDQIYPERIPKFEIKFNDDLVEQREERMLIIDPEIVDYDASDKISSFIASKELKDEFDEIYKELDAHKNEFIKKLKNTSKSTDCESEIITTFSESEGDTFFDVLDKVTPLLESEHEKYDFQYNDIFDKKGSVKKFLEKHQNDLDTYVQNYESLITQSTFFKKSDNSFGTY